MKLFCMFENKRSVSFYTAKLIPLEQRRMRVPDPYRSHVMPDREESPHQCSSSAITTYHKNRYQGVTPEIQGPYNDGVIISGVEIIQVLISRRKQNLKGC